MRGLAWLIVYGYMLIISGVMEQGRGGVSALLSYVAGWNWSISL